MPAIPVFRRLRQEDQEFKTSLGYKARVYLKINIHKFGKVIKINFKKRTRH
jgi:hypothetical protein